MAEPLDSAQIAATLRLPANYLAKILQMLARAGLLRSTRGTHGGYCIALPADQIALLAIVEPFENAARRPFCLLGRPECDGESSCEAHLRWRHVVDTYQKFLRESTLADLLAGEPRGRNLSYGGDEKKAGDQEPAVSKKDRARSKAQID